MCIRDSCKEATCHQAIINYPTLIDNLCDDCRTHYGMVQQTLKDNGIEFVHDNNLVRGLDYYTNTAFEVHIPGIGAQSAVVVSYTHLAGLVRWGSIPDSQRIQPTDEGY